MALLGENFNQAVVEVLVEVAVSGEVWERMNPSLRCIPMYLNRQA